MNFIDLIASLPEKQIIGNPQGEVTGLAYHSAAVREGFLFAAVRGLREDGNRFIPDALSRGARFLLLDRAVENPAAVQVVVPDVREALARLSCVFYNHPSSSLVLIGITGTNGKTTTSYLIESILAEAGKKVGVIGTVNYRYPGREMAAPTTTPESVDLQRALRDMRDAGVTHAVLEVSSHSLDLQRVRGCDFDAALFTNLTRDHLDYHASMEAYFRAKQLLFSQALAESRKEKRFAVINMDDPHGEELFRVAAGFLIRYGVSRRGEIWPEEIKESADGIRCRLATPRGSWEARSPLIGRHNLYNLLCAVGAAEALEIPPKAIASGIARLQKVPGRLERVPAPDGIQVFVDYAHTPDALARALETLRRLRPARLIVVFGCGGDRDRGKRPVMGKVGAAGSEIAVITSDNPRTEDPLGIIGEVEEGARSTGRRKLLDMSAGLESPGYIMVPDRREAIRGAIGIARSGDMVLIAGKGHEDYQILGYEKFHFDDREEAASALASLAGRGRDLQAFCC